MKNWKTPLLVTSFAVCGIRASAWAKGSKPRTIHCEFKKGEDLHALDIDLKNPLQGMEIEVTYRGAQNREKLKAQVFDITQASSILLDSSDADRAWMVTGQQGPGEILRVLVQDGGSAIVLSSTTVRAFSQTYENCRFNPDSDPPGRSP